MVLHEYLIKISNMVSFCCTFPIKETTPGEQIFAGKSFASLFFGKGSTWDPWHAVAEECVVIWDESR